MNNQSGKTAAASDKLYQRPRAKKKFSESAAFLLTTLSVPSALPVALSNALVNSVQIEKI